MLTHTLAALRLQSDLAVSEGDALQTVTLVALISVGLSALMGVCLMAYLKSNGSYLAAAAPVIVLGFILFLVTASG